MKPPEVWQRHFINLLLQPLPQPAAASASSSSGPSPAVRTPSLSCESLSTQPAAMDDLITAMDAWAVQAPTLLLQQLTVGIIPWMHCLSVCPSILFTLVSFRVSTSHPFLHPQVSAVLLSESAPETATRLLQYLANQRRWAPDLSEMEAAGGNLIEALTRGALTSSLHAPLLYALARASSKKPLPPPRPPSDPSDPPSTSTPADVPSSLRGYAPSRSSLASAVSSCQQHMAAYSVEHLCTVFTSLVALDQASSKREEARGNDASAASGAPSVLLTAAWMDQFYDYASPSQCPTVLLPGLATALATAMTLSSSAAAATRAAEGEEEAPAGGPSARPPSSWLRRLEAAMCEGANELSSRDAAMLLSAFGRLGFRPEETSVQKLLDLSLARAQREVAMRKRKQDQAAAAARQGQPEGLSAEKATSSTTGGAAGGVGVEAAGMAGLLAAANSSLGFVPTAAWAKTVRTGGPAWLAWEDIASDLCDLNTTHNW